MPGTSPGHDGYRLARIAEPRLGRTDLADRAGVVAGRAGRTGARDLAADPVVHALGGVAGGEVVVDHRLEALDLSRTAAAGRHAEGARRHARRGLFRRRGRGRAGRLSLAGRKQEGGEYEDGQVTHRKAPRMQDDATMSDSRCPRNRAVAPAAAIAA
ncbi:hypothetical protein BOSEA31B_10817 [Hyphomicrobiales bacterium]|nr:hypothetical protein BOSEA31B_10817 [Hyphomicrobiales bacterium]CAH1700669.1 hypothetical protein BOSEA1005_20369 [Hyphomicrobiales bacterium]CAI0344518.1 hypothetical protein BO1005MUT1_330185 [Hyphomicrobiales bacterium]